MCGFFRHAEVQDYMPDIILVIFYHCKHLTCYY